MSFVAKLFAVPILCLIFIISIWVILDVVFDVGVPTRIQGMSMMKNDGLPIFGNLFDVLQNPARKYMAWSRQGPGREVFQSRIGVRRVVVVNSFDSCKTLLKRYSSSTNSRPVLYIFHDIVSITQGFTIGSTPAGESYSRKKKVISMNLNSRSVESFLAILDGEITTWIQNIMLNNSELQCLPSCNCPRCYIHTPVADLDLMRIAQLCTLKVAVRLSYGINLDTYGADRAFADKIIAVEATIIKLRLPISNLEDSLPILRWSLFSMFNNSVIAAQSRKDRDSYMSALMESLDTKLRRNEPVAANSIVGRILKSSNHGLNHAEVQSICLTLISAGLDNTPLNFNHLMGHLSQPKYGSIIQKKAFEDIMHVYDNDLMLAWESIPYETSCKYVLAMLYETFRFFSVLPLNLPRQTTKNIIYKSAVIPLGTTIFFNAFAANHDPRVFKEPDVFNPDRWLIRKEGEWEINPNISHFAFGEGSRKCSGNILATRELYIMVSRMILLFKIKAPSLRAFLMTLDPFENNSCLAATSFEPKVFKVKLEKRNCLHSDHLYNLVLRSKAV